MNTLKKDWSPETTFAHVLSVIRCLLIVPFPESSLNDEAGKLFMDSYEEYAKRARLMADVHGRSCQTGGKSEEDDGTPAKETGGKDSTATNSVLSDASVSRSNPLRSNNGPSGSTGKSGNGNLKKTVSAGKSGKMSKKKSLKRL